MQSFQIIAAINAALEGFAFPWSVHEQNLTRCLRRCNPPNGWLIEAFSDFSPTSEAMIVWLRATSGAIAVRDRQNVGRNRPYWFKPF